MSATRALDVHTSTEELNQETTSPGVILLPGVNAVFVHHPGIARYQFNDAHPFHPLRQLLTIDLLENENALSEVQRIMPVLIDEELLHKIHRRDYVEAVKQLSLPMPALEWVEKAERYGLRSEDTPYFPGMHDAALMMVSGTVTAMDEVLSGRALHAYHVGGGLHHAFPDHGAGFCVYNDLSIAMMHARETYGARVLYVDTDVHHGDGVQWSFYNDRDICTFSIHETGKFLFPGTGYVYERGNDEGRGAGINLPMEPYTEDDSWLECFEQGLTRVIETFKPDVILSQHGCDAHALDPLSHTFCSMRIYREMPRIIHRLAHAYCGGRWVATGGGGYDMWRVVPRAWSLVWLEMTEHPLMAEIDRYGAQLPLPRSWHERWVHHPVRPADEALPQGWLDDVKCWPIMPRRAEISTKNRETTLLAIQEL
jgi:acetoin utilization protein AcuC